MEEKNVGFDGLIVGAVLLILVGICSGIYLIAGVAFCFLVLLVLGCMAARHEQRLDDAGKRIEKIKSRGCSVIPAAAESHSQTKKEYPR